jgi:hypothetical protein
MLDTWRFEWRYQTSRLSFLAAVAFFVGMGYVMAATGYGPNDLLVNSAYSIAQSIGFLGLLSVFAVTLFASQAALRDSEHGMAEIVYATGVSKASYLGGRLAGALAAASAAFACGIPGLLVGAFAAGHDPTQLGPVRLAAYLWPCALLIAPNLLLVTALLFAVALLSRSTIASYVAGVVLYMGYFVSALYTGSPLLASSSPQTAEGMARAALADPFGLSAFYEQTAHWTVGERNERLLSASGHLLANRLLWLAVAALVLALTYRLFSFRLRAGAQAGGIDPAPEAGGGGLYLPTAAAQGHRAGRRALSSAASVELRHAFHSWPLFALLVGWVGVNAMSLLETFRHAELGTAIVPTTGLVIGELGQPLTLFGLILVAYYAAELVWRERTTGMAEIVDATPAASGVLCAAKLIALTALLGILIATAVAVAVAFQVACGVTDFEPALYASLLYYRGLPLLLVAVLAVLLQTLAPHRHVGLLATVVAAIVWHLGAASGPQHPLLRYAAAPGVPYSAITGFGPEALSFGWFMTYWGAFAGLLAMLAGCLWRRGTDPRLGPRVAALPYRLRGVAGYSALGLSLAWLGVGTAVFRQTNRLNLYRTDAEVEASKAAYERAYRHLETLAQPAVVDVATAVDLYPQERRYRVRGQYLLANRSTEAIATVWVVVRRDLARADLELAGHRPTAIDPDFGVRTFVVEPPLAPGAQTALTFDLEVHRQGATADAPDRDIVGNGSFMFGSFFLPTIGYRRTYELEDPRARRRQGLGPSSRLTTLDAPTSGLADAMGTRVGCEATVSTSADQIALAPGELVRSWEADGRHTFVYRAERVMPTLAIASARYAVRRTPHGDVAIEVFHQPGHERNIDRMIAAAGATLDLAGAQFGPYPHSTLRIVELPAGWREFAGFAMPGTIYLVEDRGFLTDTSDPARVDVVSKRVAHEVAHQWFGHLLSPRVQPGASAVVETPARYVEQRVLASLDAESAVPRLLAFELDRYLRGRTGGDEVPLSAVADQDYLYYAKGALVMAATRDLIGETATHAALRRLITDAQQEPPPTARDLVTHLEEAAAPGERELLEQWWDGIVLYDLRVADARARRRPDGRFDVTVTITAAKSDWRGEQEAPLVMDEELELAVYADDPGVAGEPTPTLSRARHRVGATTTLTLVVAAADDGTPPQYVAIDPGFLRIERDRGDNVRRIAVSE